MAKVNRPEREYPTVAVAGAAAATHVHRDPGKASRVAGARYQREVKGTDGWQAAVRLYS